MVNISILFNCIIINQAIKYIHEIYSQIIEIKVKLTIYTTSIYKVDINILANNIFC